MDSKSIHKGLKELYGPEALAGAAKNMPVSLCDMNAGRAFLVGGSILFDACVAEWVSGREQSSLV